MSLKRKLKRKGLNKSNCCGKQMTLKPGYGLVCEKCGKVRRDNHVW